MEHAQSVPTEEHADAPRLPSIWRPRPSTGAPLVVAAVIALALIAAACFYVSATGQGDLPVFALRVAGAVLIAGALLALLALVGMLSMRYQLHEEGLVIRWLFQRWYVPYACVDGVFSGQRLGRASQLRGLNWPGYHVGRSRSKSTGVVHYVATTQHPPDLTLITTAYGGFAISPEQPEAFRSALISHLELSEPAPGAAPSVAISGGMWLRALGDPLGGWATLGAALVLVVTAAYLLLGGGDAVGAAPASPGTGAAGASGQQLAPLAAIGAVLLAGNYLAGAILHRYARAAAVVFWVGGLLAQLALLVGAIRLVAQ